MPFDNEKKENNSAETAYFLPPMYRQPSTGAGEQPPVYFMQQPLEETQKLTMDVEGQPEGCRKNWGCKRKSWKCCWKDDGRPLGSQTDFMVNLFFGTAFPIFSLLITFGMETSKLSRVGILFGHANFFLVTAAVALSGHHSCTIVLLLTLFGFLWLAISFKNWCRFIWTFYSRIDKKEEEMVRTISQAGCCFQFWTGLLASLVLPVIGTAIVLIARRNYLRSRYGALFGLSLHFIVCGIVASVKGFPPVFLLLGLIIAQSSAVHFRRAIICAEAK